MSPESEARFHRYCMLVAGATVLAAIISDLIMYVISGSPWNLVLIGYLVTSLLFTAGFFAGRRQDR